MSDTQEAPPEGTEPEAPPEAKEPTLEEILDARDQKLQESIRQGMQSWMGRRDKDLMAAIAEKMDAIKPKEKVEFNFEDPIPQIEQQVKQIISREQKQEQEYLQSVVTAAGMMMESDDLFSDVELGNEVVQVIKSDIGKVKKGVSPDVAAEILVGNALKKVYKARTQQKKTALDGKQPTKGLGTITPSSKKKEPDMPKLSDKAAELVKRWNMNPEDVKKVLGE
jgi:hypothetical protein